VAVDAHLSQPRGHPQKGKHTKEEHNNPKDRTPSDGRTDAFADVEKHSNRLLLLRREIWEKKE
jgi:hypothetical protein